MVKWLNVFNKHMKLFLIHVKNTVIVLSISLCNVAELLMIVLNQPCITF